MRSPHLWTLLVWLAPLLSAQAQQQIGPPKDWRFEDTSPRFKAGPGGTPAPAPEAPADPTPRDRQYNVPVVLPPAVVEFRQPGKPVPAEPGQAPGGQQSSLTVIEGPCVTEVMKGADTVCREGTMAAIVNHCAAKIDVRICIMSTRGKWVCEVEWGLQPLKRYTASSCIGTDQVHVSTRMNGQSTPFRILK